MCLRTRVCFYTCDLFLYNPPKIRIFVRRVLAADGVYGCGPRCLYTAGPSTPSVATTHRRGNTPIVGDGRALDARARRPPYADAAYHPAVFTKKLGLRSGGKQSRTP